MARMPAHRDAQDIRDEARAHVGALRDLGPEYEEEIVESFLQKIEKAFDARIEAKLNLRLPQAPVRRINPVAVLAVAMTLGIPLTAVAGGIGGLNGIIVVWFGIVFLVLLRRASVSHCVRHVHVC